MPENTELELKNILKAIRKNTGEACELLFGFSPKEHFDGLIIAPGWKPRILDDAGFGAEQRSERWYTSSYVLTHDAYPDIRIAWVQCAAGSANLIDAMIPCLAMNFDRTFFIGAAGGLTEDVKIGDLYTPSECVNPDIGAAAYLHKRLFPNSKMPTPVIEQDSERIEDVKTYAKDIKVEKVFCTDSIALEYVHLDEIRKTGAKLIEMETGAFLRIARMSEKPAYILLVVSDNSSAGKGVMTGEDREKYLFCRGTMVPDVILRMCAGN